MANIRIKDFVNEALASNTSLTNAWFAVDKESPDRSEKMNATEMFKMDETKIPFIGQNYIVVNAKGDEEANYLSLLSAVGLANALTPNGIALSATNRAVIYLWAGRYVTASSVVPLAPNAFVDIIGIGAREEIIIGSNSALAVIKLLNTNNNIFKNFTIENLGAGESFGWNSSQTDNSVMDSLIIKSKTTENTIFAGNYTNLNCTVDEILNGSITGKVYNSEFQQKSCGYSATDYIEVSGDVVNNKFLTTCCGSTINSDVLITGNIQNNKSAGYGCYGYSSGNGNITIDTTATIISNRSTGNLCFGASAGNGNIIIDGYLYDNKSSTGASFGYTAGGSIDNDGIFEKCDSTADSFGNTSPTGRLISCKRTSAYGSHAGFIEKCDFIGNLEILDGATVRRCDIDQGKIIATTNIQAKIYLNSLDQNYDTVHITNLIATPYNVIDTNI